MSVPTAEAAAELLDLRDRLALRITEAAALVGLSENTFRQYLLPRCPKFRAGRSVRIPSEAFRRYVASLPDTDFEDRETAAEIVARVAGRTDGGA